MPLVSYSDSDSESESVEDVPPPAKRARTKTESKLPLPPLPAAFRNLYATNVRVSTYDDPSLHEGRKRVIPHTPGNWPSHLQLEWYPNAKQIKPLECLIKDAAAVTNSGAQEGDADAVVEVRSLLYNDLGVQLPLHISLSRTLALSTESKDAFAETMKRLVSDSGIEPFTLAVTSLSWESNYEKTRWFLVLGIEKPPNNELNRLLRLSNTAARNFGQPLLYDNEETAKYARRKRDDSHDSDSLTVDHTNHFHISIAWTLQEPSAKGKERLSAIDLRRIKEMAIYFDCMKARIGNNVVTLPFSTRKNAQESGIGLI